MTGMQAYLEAKRTVDDRALNRRVRERFAAELTDRDEPVRIVELGAGVGTMIVRLAEWGLFPTRVCYRAIDHDATTIERARELVPADLERAGYDVTRGDTGAASDASGSKTTFVARGRPIGQRDASDSSDASDASQCLEITLEEGDALALEDTADIVIASAFLDLVDLEAALPAIESVLCDDGLLYAPITFDAGTTFAPRDPIDERIERQYHRHMDECRTGGRSDAGRALLTRLPERDWRLLAAGGSDWIVRPDDESEGYPADERVVVAHVLETIDNAVADVSANSSPVEPSIPPLEPHERTRWFERRCRELERGDLVVVATNIDVLARAP